MLVASKDPTVRAAFYLLTQIPLAAKKVQFAPELRGLGLKLADAPSLSEVISAFGDAVDRMAHETRGRTDFGEMVQLAAAESLNAVVGRELPRLFGTTPSEVQNKLAGLATQKQFSVLARDFFARLTRRYLDYYLSRELPKHAEIAGRFHTIREHREFEEALELHCRETARIVERYSGEWFSKENYEGGIDQAKASRFIRASFDKIQKELRMRRDADA